MIKAPEEVMSIEERCHQIWSVHPRDLDRLGYTNKYAEDNAIVVNHNGGGIHRLGCREHFYLRHFQEATKPTLTMRGETDISKIRNLMRDYDGGEMRLSVEDADTLIRSLEILVRSTDTIWETAAGRKLTDEEKS